MFSGKMFKRNLLLKLIDTREMNLILRVKMLEYKGLAQLL